GLNLCSRRRQRPVNQKAGEFAAHVATRTDPLHDLLPDVAALTEMESAGLFGFLWQVALANILAILGDPQRDTVQIEGSGADRFGARSEERRVGKECRSRGSPYD